MVLRMVSGGVWKGALVMFFCCEGLVSGIDEDCACVRFLFLIL